MLPGCDGGEGGLRVKGRFDEWNDGKVAEDKREGRKRLMSMHEGREERETEKSKNVPEQ